MENMDTVSLVVGWIAGVFTPFAIGFLLLGLNRMVQNENDGAQDDPQDPG